MPRPPLFAIAEPCHENWERMSPDERGRFCAACQKAVYDFTDKTEADIMSVYEANEGKLCGRFRADQIYTPPPPNRWLRTFLAALFAAFTGWLFVPTVQAQDTLQVMGKAVAAAPVETVTFQVKVIDNFEAPLFWATCLIVSNENVCTQHAETDESGIATIILDKQTIRYGCRLEIHYLDYEKAILTIPATILENDLIEIKLKESEPIPFIMGIVLSSKQLKKAERAQRKEARQQKRQNK